MKVLQVNVLVDSGSTGKIVRDIDNVLVERGIDSIICYGRKDTANKKRTFKFCTEYEAALQKILNRLGLVTMYGGNYLSTQRLISKIKKEAPDIVHIHCINGYCVNIYRLMDYLAESGIKTLVTHHAEFYYTGNCGHAFECMKFSSGDECRDCKLPKRSAENARKGFPHESWRKMNELFHRFKPGCLHFTAVSPWVKERSALSPIVKGYPCTVVMNGIDTSVFHYISETADVKARLPQGYDKIVFHATASFTDRPSLKGGHYIIELAKQMPDLLFVVAASYVDISGSLPKNILLWGRAKDQNELARLYSAADVTVITSRRETFSMIVAESLCCGTPVAGFKAGGPETIAIETYSEFVPYGDINALARAVSGLLDKSINSESISAEGFQLYSKERMVESYLNVYKQILD